MEIKTGKDENHMGKNGFMPDYSLKGRLKRWLAGIWWRWVTKKPPIVH